jgi:FHA domain-containing protein
MEGVLKPAAEGAPVETETRPSAEPSVIDELIEIRHRQRRLNEYRTRAQEMRDRIDGQVFQKVLTDYEARYAELERSAASLIEQAKTEYQKLSNEWAQITRVAEQAKQAAAEAAFRHAVGEIDDAALGERVRGPEQVQSSCAEKLAALGAQRARFAEALPGLDLEPRPIQKPAAPAPAVPAPAAGHTVVHESVGATADIGSLPANSGADDMTMILPDAVLVATHAPGERFRLAVVNYLGRGDDNQVRLTSEDVSHRHAVIMATRHGFVVKDLQSRNGTFVNGERIQEHALLDGDRLQLGSLELTFRMPGHAAATQTR